MIVKIFLLPLIFFLLLPALGKAQISPGDLSQAHAHLEGIRNCTNCHELGEKVTNNKCLSCHTEIKELINNNRGFHSSKDVIGKNCWNCHSEHHGREFKIVNFEPRRFDHSKTKFKLTGSHTKIDCNLCHQPKFISDPDIKKRENTWLGLSMDCSSCHEDIHKATLGNDCSTCHNSESFSPAIKFDHNKTRFKLTGAHKKIECIECHPKQREKGKELRLFSVKSFSTCESCHNDPHNGKFGKDCQSCHSTESFQKVNKANFDHDKTNFPLIGKHQNVSCSGCHGGDLSSKPKHDSCIDCHEDYHKGEFSHNGKVKDCSLCHTEKGFSPSTFSYKDHQQTVFPLTGSHLAIPCQSCHYEDEWHFDLSSNCIDCHENVHGNEISADYMKDNNCTFCHSTESWSTINFDHNKTGFPLLGEHSNISCGSCHTDKTSAKVVYKFASLDEECKSCHGDPHFGQFKNNCSLCHTFSNWRPDKFDHEKTEFPLQGAHSLINCNECHKTVTTNGNSFVQYKIKDFKCADCHS